MPTLHLLRPATCLLVLAGLACSAAPRLEESAWRSGATPRETVTATLYTEHEHIGTKLPPARNRVGSVSFGIAQAARVPLPDARTRRSVEGRERTLYAVQLRCSIHELPQARRIERLWLRIELPPEATVVDLSPSRPHVKAVRADFYVHPRGTLSASPRGAVLHLPGMELPPRVHGLGKGHAGADWYFVGDGSSGIPAGDYDLLLLVELPRGQKSLQARFTAEGATASYLLGRWRDPENLHATPTQQTWMLAETQGEPR